MSNDYSSKLGGIADYILIRGRCKLLCLQFNDSVLALNNQAHQLYLIFFITLVSDKLIH